MITFLFDCFDINRSRLWSLSMIYILFVEKFIAKLKKNIFRFKTFILFIV